MEQKKKQTVKEKQQAIQNALKLEKQKKINRERRVNERIDALQYEWNGVYQHKFVTEELPPEKEFNVRALTII